MVQFVTCFYYYSLHVRASAIFQCSLTDKAEAATITTAVAFAVVVEEAGVVVIKEEGADEILEEVAVVEGEVLHSNTWRQMALDWSQQHIISVVSTLEEEAAHAVRRVGWFLGLFI